MKILDTHILQFIFDRMLINFNIWWDHYDPVSNLTALNQDGHFSFWTLAYILAFYILGFWWLCTTGKKPVR